MHVLVLHSEYRSGTLSGENRVVEEEAALLREGGHEVTTVTPTVPGGRGAVLAAAVDAVWSAEATRKLRRLVRSHRCDVVHIHNLFPTLSPAVIRAAAAEGVPVVMTLHNFRLLCLPATLLRDGRVCEDCVGRGPWRGVLHGCYRGSRPASLPVATSLALHRRLRTFDLVTRFLAVSEFVRRKHALAGLPADRIAVKPNFASPAPRRSEGGEYFLYLGRLSPEKGVATLLEAWRPSLGTLLLAGDGPEAPRLRRMAPPGARFLGAVEAAEVQRLLLGARALLVPSKGYEACPRSVVEACAAAVPVVASKIGALPELVEDGVTGILVSPDDPAAWAEACEQLLDARLAERMGEGAWRRWSERYTPERALAALEAAYAAAVATAGAGRRPR